MSSLIVGISDCKVSNDPEALLMTYALGSCIAVAAHDPVVNVAGLLHFMLPESALDEAKARANPYMFADSGIPMLLKTICERGGNQRRLVVRIVGGAQILSGHELFQIGRRNYLAARKLLWLCREAQRLQLTGVQLKDRSDLVALSDADVERLPPLS